MPLNVLLVLLKFSILDYCAPSKKNKKKKLLWSPASGLVRHDDIKIHSQNCEPRLIGAQFTHLSLATVVMLSKLKTGKIHVFECGLLVRDMYMFVSASKCVPVKVFVYCEHQLPLTKTNKCFMSQ